MKNRSPRLFVLAVLIFSLGVLLLTCDFSEAAASGNKKKKARKKAQPTRRANAPKPPLLKQQDETEGDDPDLPGGVKVDKGEYLRLRDEQLGLMRGLTDKDAPLKRMAAVREMEQQERLVRQRNQAMNVPAMTWASIGPAPIPNGQTNAPTSAVSGRVSAIAVHPANPEIAYVGAAQGGVFRTTNGGATWTPIMDGALSLAIGAIAFAPNDPTTILVGTGEPALSADGFFGVGVYRIRNAESNAVLEGPFNLDTAGNDVFTGRSISELLFHPTDPNTIFVSTVSGISGLGGGALLLPPQAGLYRSTNAMSASPSFKKLNVATANGGNRQVSDIVMEPGNPNRVIAHVRGNPGAGDGGIYLSENAMAADPTFRQTFNTIATSTAQLRGELAINKTGQTVTVIAAFGDNNGTVIKSGDGGSAWETLTAGASFCNPQCFYDVAVAIDPSDAQKVYIGGSPGTGGATFKRSTNGGVNFTESSAGLHVDTHVIAVAPSNPNIIYFGSDGGVWRSNDAGVSWTTLNNSTLPTMQYQSVALHPSDAKFSIGGTQDNGTHFYRPDATWVRATGGDGGNSVIDQNATNNTAVTAYHTFFNRTNTQIGFKRITTFDPAGQLQGGANFGCGAFTANGINCADPVLFYAPLVRGPGNPNTIYMGTNRLYRSADTGVTMPAVSQALPATISSIAIAPTNDNVRLVGTVTGRVFVTTDGSATLREITGPLPNRYVGRVMIDPTSADRAFVAFTGYGLPHGQHIWRTQNLTSANPIWQPAGNGLPDVPVNALAIDPRFPGQIFAGTDIGVFRSISEGELWEPFSDGMPRVAVFDLAIQNANRLMRAATHGRSMFEIAVPNSFALPTPTPTGASFNFSATAYTANEGAGVANITVSNINIGPFGGGQPLAGAIQYTVTGGTASQRTDFILATGRLDFAAGEASKTFSVLLVDDAYVEGNETVSLSLSVLPVGSISRDFQFSTATLTITDNDTGTPTANPIDEARFFARQHYYDFLARRPDQAGEDFWTNEIASCGADAACVNARRIGVSAAFFVELEFQMTGSVVYRMYKAAFGVTPTYAQFMPDRSQLVGGADLPASTQAFAQQFVQRGMFTNEYPASLSNTEFVNKLFDRAGLIGFAAERQAAITALNGGGGRAQTLLNLINLPAFRDREYNPSFVLMQYFGYLRRDPDVDGFYFWLNILNQQPTNLRGMVCAFITSTEYQQRFAATATRTNALCDGNP
jgi:photosystem II stability/assembly factor-like uncharacterized protein